jgi:formylglycine-generating enzyme required for sulfatase activity
MPIMKTSAAAIWSRLTNANVRHGAAFRRGWIVCWGVVLASAAVASAQPPAAMPPAAKPPVLTVPFTAGETRAAQTAWDRSQQVEPVEKNSIGMSLTLVPPGEFLMGNGESVEAILEFGRSVGWTDAKSENFEDAQPQHKVRISRPYFLGTHEVTKGQFGRFVAASKYKTDAERDGKGGWWYTAGAANPFRPAAKATWREWGVEQTDDSPVVNVSWNDAVAFCDWLTKQEQRTYRLPTEAEWEFACRAGTTGRYSHGDDPEGLVKVGNVADATAHETWKVPVRLRADDKFPFTAPVGRFEPNAFGLCDMHGNVWEWCLDRADVEYYRTAPPIDPIGPAAGDKRVGRGGSWYDPPWKCLSAYRRAASPDDRRGNLGFRVARLLAAE